MTKSSPRNNVPASLDRVAYARAVEFPDAENVPAAGGTDVAERAAARTDVRRAMLRLRPRDRALLWLAYAQGQPHAEIARTLGVKTGSIKLLLFRARKRLAGMLRGSQPDAGRLA